MTARLALTTAEQRVIGCLLEKEITTPDQYPLSLNSLTNACNQKSNRDPVMSLTESDVQDALDELKEKRLITTETGFGSRVIKYRHRFCNTEFGELKLTEKELGIICVLFLRGAQTPGELRTRTSRLCEFSDVSEVDSALRELTQRNDGPFVSMLEREPGKRESRYTHLLGHDSDPTLTHIENVITPNNETQPTGNQDNDERIAYLELRVDELENTLAKILERLH
ncbi:DUF480 domain-containing protein [Gammaproteobacteria bacterium 45_16_T64]|nr:DUF480 domain-containing protein [Gammaproteobacteria bacterium 45_16_T64]